MGRSVAQSGSTGMKGGGCNCIYKCFKIWLLNPTNSLLTPKVVTNRENLEVAVSRDVPFVHGSDDTEVCIMFTMLLEHKLLLVPVPRPVSRLGVIN